MLNPISGGVTGYEVPRTDKYSIGDVPRQRDLPPRRKRSY